MAIGDVQGQNFKLPAGRYIGQQPPIAPVAPGVAPELGLPPLNDAYANVQGITDEFYNTVGQLKNYAHELNKKYGIDVTSPDFSAGPGGGQPFRTFQELTAKAIMTANDLKESMRRNTLDEAAQRAGTFIGSPDFNSGEQLSSQAEVSQRGTPTALLPEVAEAAKSLMRVYDTKAGASRANAAFKQPLVQKLQALIQTDPDNAVFYQRQIDALPDAMYEPPIFAPNSSDAGKEQKREAIVDLYKRTTNLLHGAFEEGNFETKLDENFKPVFTNTELSGTPLGSKDFVVKKQKKSYPLVMDGIVVKNGKVFMTFQQPEEAQKDNFKIPDEDITGTKGDLFLKRLIQYNKGMGLNTTELITALKEANLYTSTGSKDEEVVRKDLVRSTENIDTSRLDQAVSAMRESMKKTKSGPIFRGTVPSSGQKIEVIKNNPLIGSVKYEISVDGDVGSYSEKDALDKMREYGIFDQFIQFKKPPADPVVNKGGKKAY